MKAKLRITEYFGKWAWDLELGGSVFVSKRVWYRTAEPAERAARVMAKRLGLTITIMEERAA